ncbi:MAG: hypothetical protein KatS3mg013_2061 [Actinomycetota bacterium]|nr:MAG: hypothetical protein KatS3mg013_2061 [Actinomycetota bacterium]
MIDGALAGRTPRLVPDGRTFAYVLADGDPRIVVTQADVRAIQLAKAALAAGCRLLLDRWGTEGVDRIRLAGAFGTHLDPLHALVLGLVPDCEVERVTPAGNAAGTGARIALLNRGARAEIERVVRTVEKVETAVEPRVPGALRGVDGDPARHGPPTSGWAPRSTCPSGRSRPRGGRRRRGGGAVSDESERGGA